MKLQNCSGFFSASVLLLISLFASGTSALQQRFPSIKKDSLHIHFSNPLRISRDIRSATLALVISLIPLQPSFASDVIYSNELLKTVESIIRTKNSLSYIQEDINSKGDVSSVVSQIKFLNRGSSLRDFPTELFVNLPVNKIDIKAHARSAYEDLAAIYEYFEDEIDNFSGKRTPPATVLPFADKAVKAASKEIVDILSMLPSSLVNEATTSVENRDSGRI